MTGRGGLTVPTIDLGDQLPSLSLQVLNFAGALAPAASVVLTLALPDGTNVTPTVTTPSTGVYSATYTTVQAGRHTGRWVITTITGGAAQEIYVDTWDVDDTAALSPIVGLADVKAHLGITSPATDDRLRAYALLASQMVERHTRRTYRRRTVIELHDGGTDTIILRQSPVQSVTSVTVSGTLVPTTDYTPELNAGLVLRNATVGAAYWVGGAQNVSVVYVVGAAVVPWHVRQGCLELIRHLWDSQRGGYSIPKQQGAGDTWDPRQGYSVPRRVAELLDSEIGPGF